MRLLIYLIILPSFLSAQEINVFSGKVMDSESGEALINATVHNKVNDEVSYTDEFGQFTIEKSLSSDSILVSYIGYRDTLLVIDSTYQNSTNIYLKQYNELKIVEVKSQKRYNNSEITFNIEELEMVPTIGATVDVMKSLQSVSGVSPSQEGRSDLIVRGGNPGENKYLIDDVPLIYVNHLGGFLSVFNSEMINKLKFYKDVFPSKYSGALSSILSIQQKEGNFKEWKGTFQVGLLNINGSVEGPLSDKVSMIITARKTLFDYLMLGATILSDQDFLVSYGFHDINSKVTYRINSNNFLYFNVYSGDDYLNYRNKKSKIQEYDYNQRSIWGNTMFSAKYRSILNDKLVSNTVAAYTRYRLNNKDEYRNPRQNIDNVSSRSSSLANFLLRSDWKYFISSSQDIEFGTVNKVIPNTPISSTINKDSLIAREENTSYLNSLYTDYNLRFGDGLDISLGAQFKRFQNETYSFIGTEPRIKAKYSRSLWNVHVGYMKVFQESHLLGGTGGILPNEIWIPSSGAIPASESQLFSLGGRYIDSDFSVGINAYYKKTENLTTYLDGYNAILGDSNWRQKLARNGSGEAYGIEGDIKYNFSSLSLNANYTYSRSYRTYENINEGKQYPYDYDRPHYFNLIGNYKLNDKWSFNFSFNYSTGLPYTSVLGKYLTESTESPGEYYEVILYGDKNSARFKDYHRLDISATYSYRTKKRGRRAEWKFSLYNVYAHKNPFHYYLNVDDGPSLIDPSDSNYYTPGDLGLYQISYFPIIPSFSYKIYFGTATKTKPERKRKSFGEWFFDE